MAQKPVTTLNGEQIQFRRIRGRIVPIRNKKGSSPARAPKRQREHKAVGTAKAAGLFSGGIVAGLFGGSAFAEFGKESDRARAASKSLAKRGSHIKAQEKWLIQKIRKKGASTGVFSPRTGVGSHDVQFLRNQAKTFKKSAARQRLRSTRLSKQGFTLGATSLALGGFLASQGVRKGMETFDKDGKLNIGQQGIADIGATVAVGAAAHELGLKRSVSRKAAKKLLKKILSKGRL